MTTQPASTLTIGQTLNDLDPGVFRTLAKIKPMGAVQARKLAAGAVQFFWRYSIGTKSERVPIGIYDPLAPPKSLAPTPRGYSFAAAVRAAEELALQHHAHRGEGGRPAVVAAQLEAKRQAAAQKREAEKHTLQHLLDDYCDYLEGLGRQAHRDARSIFKLHVVDAWPDVAAKPANQVSGEEIADMMRRVLERGKGRTANKLRSYVRAAYQTARAARSKASIPLKFKDYAVVHNPAADTEPDETQNKADKRPLTLPELRTYWKAIKGMEGLRGAALRLHLLTGGQRIEQLVNLRTSDVREATIVLFDGKGRPGKPPRPHTLPLVPDAAVALLELAPAGDFAISTDGGKTHLAATTLSAWAVEAAKDIPEFQAKRIRSGIETLLASVGITKEIRGRLQSHGVAGVQDAHYNAYDYMEEKRAALQTLQKLLEQPKTSNVTTLKAKKRA